MLNDFIYLYIYILYILYNIPFPSKLLNLDVSITPNRLYHFQFLGGFKGVNSSPVSTVVEDILGFLFCGRGRITATLDALLDWSFIDAPTYDAFPAYGCSPCEDIPADGVCRYFWFLWLILRFPLSDIHNEVFSHSIISSHIMEMAHLKYDVQVNTWIPSTFWPHGIHNIPRGIIRSFFVLHSIQINLLGYSRCECIFVVNTGWHYRC